MGNYWQPTIQQQSFICDSKKFFTVNKYKKEYYKRELSTVTLKQLKLIKLSCWAKQKKNKIITVRAVFLSVTNKIKTDFFCYRFTQNESLEKKTARLLADEFHVNTVKLPPSIHESSSLKVV